MSPRKGRTKQDPESSGDEGEEYRKKRDRNNMAVKRSRVKSKQKTEETQKRVTELRQENSILEEKVKSLTKELGFLKKLFLAHASNSADSKEFENVDLQTLLSDDIPGEGNTNVKFESLDNMFK